MRFTYLPLSITQAGALDSIRLEAATWLAAAGELVDGCGATCGSAASIIEGQCAQRREWYARRIWTTGLGRQDAEQRGGEKEEDDEEIAGAHGWDHELGDGVMEEERERKRGKTRKRKNNMGQADK